MPPSIVADESIQGDVALLGVEALNPVSGFMSEEDYRSVVRSMHLKDGSLWPIPICLPLTEETAQQARRSGKLEIRTAQGGLLAVVAVTGTFAADKDAHARAVFGTTDARHPGVRRLQSGPGIFAAGPLLEFHPESLTLPMRCMTPKETRRAFSQRGWKTITGFQTRNPIHRAHEHLLRLVLERTDGLLLHPLVGATREEDVPAAIRVRCYEALIEGYLPTEKIVLSGMPGPMYYAGPKEAVLHAIIRRNYGCTHFVVGRDHAGVGGFYAPFAAQELLKSLPPAELGIELAFFSESFWCRRCGGMETARTCGHSKEDRLSFSGTFIRDQLRKGGEIPPECIRPEVLDILRKEWGALARPSN